MIKFNDFKLTLIIFLSAAILVPCFMFVLFEIIDCVIYLKNKGALEFIGLM